LAVILVGGDPASAVYVRNKVKACEEAGFHSVLERYDATMAPDALLARIAALNADAAIHGILVQMPLPPQVDSRRILLAIAPEKDVDGFHPFNVGQLVANAPGPRACTPAGVMELLRRAEIPIAGRNAVIVGRSDIVGKPMALLLLHQHATVTICHSKTADLPGVCRRADILVAAMGRAGYVTGDFIREGATVIDVGINRVTDRSEAARLFRGDLSAFDRKGSVIAGDVHPLDVAERAGAYTPVPGGVGPLTIAMLMANTVAAAERASG
ncbi:MAG TPA: bifunctional methylenetetrahydrofolate dehydrogenase/methenyltetrahydrofolate cyclohydrolase, partial [Solibacterales bacterium]|nr:bifunctional methylenetetrahydrofolate dehydrogenase/methenyltetrahydrofolate cyclohydrolase [Bryobacterales bacterium]